jgi:hypothetical protein
MRTLIPLTRKVVAGLGILIFTISAARAVDAILTGDTFVSSSAPRAVNSAASFLTVATNSRSFLQFDFSPLPTNSTGAYIQKAVLRIFVNKVTKAGTFNVYTASSNWNEATLRFTGAPTNGTLEAVGFPVATNSVNNELIVDVTSLVKDWVDRVDPNRGIIITTTTANFSFVSKESPTLSHPARLEIILAGAESVVAGLDGKTVLNGTGLPAPTNGLIGDFYIDTAANKIYGPKETNGWGFGTSIVGPQGPAGSNGPIGLTGAAGPTGPIGPQGPQGLKGDTGLTGPAGSKGDTGLTGPAGATGPQGLKGDTGLTGSDGAVGPQGQQGLKGDKGDTGATGPQGLKGDTGLTGPAGAEGAVGPQGPQGLKGDKGDTGLTGSAGPKGDTGAIGPQGQQGIQGLKGDTGLTGPAGATGPQGLKGDTGLTGSDGAVGPQGIKGDKGDTGAAGPAGVKGDTGLTGATGPAGVKGDTGDTGATGPQGLKGDTGLTGPAGAEGAVGPQGPQGLKGDKGDTGATGPQGLQGIQGTQGYKGDTGLAGPQGEQGLQGIKGDTGATGPQGLKGDTGATGATGPAGPQGLQGLTGEAGPQGPIGLTGPEGPAGTNGINGTNGNTVLNGTSAPSSEIGSVGDIYVDTASNNIYGPKTTDGWGSGTSIVGPKGISGLPNFGTYSQITIGITNNASSDGFIVGTVGAGIGQGDLRTSIRLGSSTTNLNIDASTATSYGNIAISIPVPKDYYYCVNGAANLYWLSVEKAALANSFGTLISGSGAPAASNGVVGDLYYDTNSISFYGPKTTNGWGPKISVVGPQGPAGPAGPTGAAGAMGPAGPAGATGATGPSGPQGAQGPHGIQGLTGPAGLQGPQGPKGDTGATGPAGTNGSTIYSGSNAPTALVGTNGDFYINTNTMIFYGPKLGDGWVNGVSLMETSNTNSTTSILFQPNPSVKISGESYTTGPAYSWDMMGEEFYIPSNTTNVLLKFDTSWYFKVWDGSRFQFNLQLDFKIDNQVVFTTNVLAGTFGNNVSSIDITKNLDISTNSFSSGFHTFSLRATKRNYGSINNGAYLQNGGNYHLWLIKNP